MLFQVVQNRRGAAAFKAAVEGQVNPFLFCFFYIIGIVLGEVGGGGVGHGSLPFLLKAQAPVGGDSAFRGDYGVRCSKAGEALTDKISKDQKKKRA